MRLTKPFKNIRTALCALAILGAAHNNVFAHGVQVGYGTTPTGFVRIYIEHWHGANGATAGDTINVTVTTPSGSSSFPVSITGQVNNSTVANLPGLTGPLTVLGTCPGQANTWLDWGFWDFAPGSCNQPISITINQGNTVVFQEACPSLYPVTIAAQTFTDQAAPVITAPNVAVTGNCVGANVNFSVSVVDDCDPNPTVTYSHASGSFFPVGVTTVTVTATDSTGKTSVKTFTVTVVASDTQPPVISALPAPSTIECPATPNFATPTATDNCGSATLTSVDTSSGTCPVVHVRTWTARDASGNFSTTSQTISVADTTKPTISAVPGPTTIECPAVPVFASPTASDSCGTATLAFVDSSSGTCPVVHVRTWTATDLCGNTETTSQTINVADTTKPTISALPSPTTIECPALPVFATPTASDTCGTAALTFVDSSSGTCPVVHTRTWTATDLCGNISTTSQTISVADTTKPTITSVPGPTTIECPAAPAFATPTASDTCGTATLTFVDSSSGTCPVVHVRTWTATDLCGNTETTSQTINVADTTKPTISAVPGPTTIECPALPVFATPTASDTCGTAALTFVDSSSGTCPVVHVRTWTATDLCGNTETTSQTISVADTTKPTISAVPGPSTIECPAVPVFATPTASDTCGTATLTFVDSSSGTCPVVHTRTWTATDACGLTSTASQTINVADTTPPTISSLTGPTGSLPLDSSPSVIVAFSDNCSVQAVVFNWDDATSTTLTAPSSPASASHTYNAAGVYSVGVTVTDACGNTVSQVFEFVVIYDPSAGFVTGGGWIDSPAGAYVADPALTGKANFGFVSKYQKGASVPTGNTEFQFKAGNLNFSITAYQWLVVAGAKAQYKGDGTINGAGNYGFLLTATDGQFTGGGGVDKFRIKIWDKATSVIVYDNRPGASDDIDAADPQAIGGGSIVIHK